MDKEYADKTMYVKPTMLDLGALAVVYGAPCSTYGEAATNVCSSGEGATGGSTKECASGLTASCSTFGGGAAT